MLEHKFERARTAVNSDAAFFAHACVNAHAASRRESDIWPEANASVKHPAERPFGANRHGNDGARGERAVGSRNAKYD